MSKRTLTALGAVLGSLLLVLGTQQAVVLTTAAWSDQVSFSAPATSGTWVVPATLAFESASLSTTKTSTFNAQQAVSLAVKNTGPITGMTLTLVVSEWGLDKPALPAVTGPWTVTSSSRPGGNVRTFNLVYNGPTPVASGQSIPLSFNHAIQCAPNNGEVHKMTATATSTAPGAVATATTEVTTPRASFTNTFFNPCW